jgi:5-methylcytosine-specific restriction enzyme subunit McrC
MAHHQLFEWERRPFVGDRAIPVEDAERIVRVAERHAARLTANPRPFDFQRSALSARSVVGLIVDGDASCEILPKIDREASGSAGSMRRQLVHMLGVAHDVPLADGDEVGAGKQGETLLEFLITRFTDMLEVQARRGFPRAYIPHADDLPAIRGRLDTTRQFSTLAARPDRLACRYDEFSVDIPLNQVMKAAVDHLYRISRSLATRRRLGELALMYADVTPVHHRQIDWARMTKARNTATWMPLVRFARLLLGQRFQDTSHGRAEGFSLLFDMNVLFEAYVARMLQTIANEQSLTISVQGGKEACLISEETGARLFETVPDVRLFRGKTTAYIVDTKWKRLKRPEEDPKLGVSQADVYQMMAYAQLYQCNHVILLYPFHEGLTSNRPVHHRIAVNGGDVRLSIATVDISSHAKAKDSLRGMLVLGGA